MMKGPVCVTGASGFLGSYVVRVLLERGYKVHGTVRDPSNPKKTNHLTSLPGAKENLVLFQADLLKEGSFDDAIKDCVCVFHTASPFFFKGGTEENLVLPAVKGTENVLDSCSKNPLVKKVVLTASTASVYAHYNPDMDPTHVWTEKDWSDLKQMRKAKAWYPISKTEAELRAWEMSKEAKWDLAVMNPTLIWGPMLQPGLNTSSAAVLSYLNGEKSEIDNAQKTVVDVRDVALAHVLAFEKEANGRFLLIGKCVSYEEVCDVLRKAEPDNKSIPTKVSTKMGSASYGAPPPHKTLFSCRKAEEELGLKFHSVKDMLEATVSSLKKHGYL
eukprot:CAMPEP_0170178984 /NCGR_PEP_ID=MMETSP0040_2-20121228/15772_1 /TAXON_ID=641309 /ORGANISM="Lotharella oceanica, Strain CCMP622" /LENGTH=329 /DNA_ID=CAMNT_0010422737 /DNA_START=84 /DNA_END=1070 /DNA_ORIENTATION=+